jgi:hypothetical protein
VVDIEIESAGRRRTLLREIDKSGVLATPANSSYNEAVIEAGRMSILDGGREVLIDYGAKPARVSARQ